MKITVRIGDIEVVVDRPNFVDYAEAANNGDEIRRNIFNDTILPTLEQACMKAKDLLNESQK